MEARTLVDNVITISDSAQEAYREAINLIVEAHNWANDPSNLPELDDPEAERREWDARQDKVKEMERSFHTNISHLIFMTQAHDGELKLWRDSMASIFFKHEKSDYHGALIFHADYAKKGTERLPVGRWSIHT